MIKNIIFDWSGTLSNNLNCFYKTCEIIFQKLGKEMPPIEEIRRNFTLPYMKFWNKHFPDLSKEKQDKLYAETIVQAGKSCLYDNVKKVLQNLNKQKINLFVLSSDPKIQIIPEMKKAGVSNLFKEVFWELHEKKHIISEILKKYNLNSNETLYIGDTSGDIEMGKKAGIKTAGITWGFQHKDILEKSKPDYLIDDIIELNLIIKNKPQRA